MENLYAIIRHGGKQYKVSAGSKIKVDKINAKSGDEFTFSDVISVVKYSEIAKFKNKGTTVKAKVLLAEVKDKKVIIFKKRRTKGYTKKQGHRQVRSEVLIESINY